MTQWCQRKRTVINPAYFVLLVFMLMPSLYGYCFFGVSLQCLLCCLYIVVMKGKLCKCLVLLRDRLRDDHLFISSNHNIVVKQKQFNARSVWSGSDKLQFSWRNEQNKNMIYSEISLRWAFWRSLHIPYSLRLLKMNISLTLLLDDQLWYHDKLSASALC